MQRGVQSEGSRRAAWPPAASVDGLSAVAQVTGKIEARVRSITFFPDLDLLYPFFHRDFPLVNYPDSMCDFFT
jgi:hypothetical protein